MESLKAELRVLSAQYDSKQMTDESIDRFFKVLGLYFTEEGIMSFSGLEVRAMLRMFVEDAQAEGYEAAVLKVMAHVHLAKTPQRTLPSLTLPKGASNVIQLFKK